MASAPAEAIVFSRATGTTNPSGVNDIRPICSSTKRFSRPKSMIWAKFSQARRYAVLTLLASRSTTSP